MTIVCLYCPVAFLEVSRKACPEGIRGLSQVIREGLRSFKKRGLASGEMSFIFSKKASTTKLTDFIDRHF